MKEHYVRKGLTVGVICLLTLTSIPMVSSNDTTSSQSNTDGLIDKVNVWCEGPYFIEILERNSVFRVTFNHTHESTITIAMVVNVTKNDGTSLFGNSVTITRTIPNRHSSTWQFWTFPEFRKAGHWFGLFNVNVKLNVHDDGSAKQVTFRALIFGIASIILDRGVK